MKRAIIASASLSRAAAAITVVATLAASARAAEPVGRYEVSGTNPGKRGTYSGTAAIE